jgi:hypothetical protein
MLKIIIIKRKKINKFVSLINRKLNNPIQVKKIIRGIIF